jgi:hypothetical protein
MILLHKVLMLVTEVKVFALYGDRQTGAHGSPCAAAAQFIRNVFMQQGTDQS